MRAVGPRLGPMVTVSAVAHTAALGLALLTVYEAPRVVYRPPAYAVDLVDALPAAARAAPTPEPAAPPPPPPEPARPAAPPAPSRAEMADLELKKKEAELERLKAEGERLRQAELERRTRQHAELERQRQEAERQGRLGRIREEQERVRAEEARREEARRQAERLARIQSERERVREAAVEAAASRLRAEQLEIKLKEYYAKARQQMLGYWILPEWARGRNVEVRVSLRVARDGRVLAITMEKRSGDPGLDHSVQNALEKARQNGLPRLPPEHTEDTLEFGVIFNPVES